MPSKRQLHQHLYDRRSVVPERAVEASAALAFVRPEICSSGACRRSVSCTSICTTGDLFRFGSVAVQLWCVVSDRDSADIEKEEDGVSWIAIECGEDLDVTVASCLEWRSVLVPSCVPSSAVTAEAVCPRRSVGGFPIQNFKWALSIAQERNFNHELFDRGIDSKERKKYKLMSVLLAVPVDPPMHLNFLGMVPR